MKPWLSCNQSPSGDWCLPGMRTGFCCIMLYAVALCPWTSWCGYILELFFFAHPTQWFTWLPMVIHFHTVSSLGAVSLPWNGSHPPLMPSTPHFQLPALVSGQIKFQSRPLPVPSSSQSSHCDETGLVLRLSINCCCWALVILFAFNLSLLLSTYTKKSKEQTSFYSCLRSFYISFASHITISHHRPQILFLSPPTPPPSPHMHLPAE